jgi:hypothetical protein
MHTRSQKPKTGDEDMFLSAVQLQRLLPNDFDRLQLNNRRQFIRIVLKIMEPVAPMLEVLKIPICPKRCLVRRVNDTFCSECNLVYDGILPSTVTRDRSLGQVANATAYFKGSLHYFPLRARLTRILNSSIAPLLKFSNLRMKDDTFVSDISDSQAYKDVLSLVRPGSTLLPLVLSWDGFELWRKAPNSKPMFTEYPYSNDL